MLCQEEVMNRDKLFADINESEKQVKEQTPELTNNQGDTL